jgi:RimJ/RimL family protein N-acetyltransferase
MLKGSDEFIGIAGLLHQIVNEVIEIEIAFRIRKENWGNGYATESAIACKKYAQNILGCKRLISIIHPENMNSIRVAQKLGAKRECSMIFDGVNHNVYVYPMGIME